MNFTTLVTRVHSYKQKSGTWAKQGLTRSQKTKAATNLYQVALSITVLLTALALLLLLPFTVRGQEPPSEEDGLLTGNYAGTVAISTPVSLSLLDLVFDISNVDGILNGTVILTQTQVYLASPLLQGSITSSPDAVTPTFRLDSEAFTATISGRQVARHFSLVGEALNDGDTLRGQYEETIEGFTPDSLLVTGTFLVVRPSRALTASSSPVQDKFVYLPLVLRK